MRKLAALLLLTLTLILPQAVSARITPEDIANEQREIYNTQVKNYSPEAKTRLEKAEKQIQLLNLKICGDLEELMTRQGQVLDEYLKRNKFSETEAIKNSRYWITYAHEAVAYQQAKIYIFSLTGEANVERDINIAINNLQSDITTLKGKVTKSQGILKTTVSGGGDTSPAKQTTGGDS